MTLLTVEHLAAGYGAVEAISDVSLDVGEGEIVALIGANGAGKSTTLRALSGLLRPHSGRAVFDGHDLTALRSSEIVALGLVQVPEGREVFARMTVEENLRLGAWRHRRRRGLDREIDAWLERFPVLERRRRQPAGALSGGEQQVLAIARALLARPRLLLMDEPSLGLAPRLVDEVFDIVTTLAAEGNTILLVEQNSLRALQSCNRGYVMETGRTVLSGAGTELLDHPEVRRAYLGV